MKSIVISDMTLSLSNQNLSFKEKIEVARQLDKLNVNVIDMPSIINETTDSLFIRTACTFIKNSTVSVSTGLTVSGVEKAFSASQNAKKQRLKIEIPVSTVQMEYTCHKKPNKLLEVLTEVIKTATSKCSDVELFLIDATRADDNFLKSLIEMAIPFGVKTVTLCDDEGVMLPDEISEFINNIKNEIPLLKEVDLGIFFKDVNGLSTANTLTAIKGGVKEIKTQIGSDGITSTKMLASVLKVSQEKLKVKTTLNALELNRIISQIERIVGENKEDVKTSSSLESAISSGEEFNLQDSLETVSNAVKKLGYDLTKEDIDKVYEEFKRVAKRKGVGYKELDAIVASTALQVPPTYSLKTYIINNGNVITSSAQITLVKNGEEKSGICMGDGPIDAAFKALEQIIGTHYELDDFEIQSITEGREAVGSAVVKLRYNGKLYSGNGVSTDIIGSSIRAYINAVNKIVYEEA